MPMHLASRFEAAEQDTVFRGRVMGAMLKHAKWVKRAAEQSSDAKALALGIIINPSDRVFGFALSIITEPVFDDIEAAEEISDTNLMDTVPVVWELFLP